VSIKVSSLVWEHAPVGGSDLLVLLALADFANDEGTNAWPSHATLARKARLSEERIRHVLRSLQKRGLILVDVQAGGPATLRRDRRPNVYTLNLAAITQGDLFNPDGGSHTTGGRQRPAVVQSTHGGSSATPNPSFIHKTPPTPRETGGAEPLPLNNCADHKRPRRGCAACSTPPPPPKPEWCGTCSDDHARQVPFLNGVEIAVTDAEPWKHAWGPCPRCHPSTVRRSA